MKKNWIYASYISSLGNKESYFESRILAPESKWELAGYAALKIVATLGMAEVDLFATRNNKKA